MRRVGRAVAPESRLERRVGNREVAPRAAFIQDFALGIERLRTTLLEDDPATVLPTKRLVELPLLDEGSGNPFPESRILAALGDRLPFVLRLPP